MPLPVYGLEYGRNDTAVSFDDWRTILSALLSAGSIAPGRSGAAKPWSCPFLLRAPAPWAAATACLALDRHEFEIVFLGECRCFFRGAFILRALTNQPVAR